MRPATGGSRAASLLLVKTWATVAWAIEHYPRPRHRARQRALRRRPADYAFGPSVRLRVGGSARARAHFDREYGPAAASCGTPEVEADVRFALSEKGAANVLTGGGHKTAHWRVELGDPRERTLHVAIGVSGGPPAFAFSLVQGYHVEPLVAMALARAGFVALPSAGILCADGALVVMGRSGSGKSSVSVRALAGGRGILGDDQVVIAADGGCWPYPRRLRLYPDVQDTAPEAWCRLRPSTRRTLRVRGAVRRASRGFVAPSLAVPISELRPPVPNERVRAARLVVVERSSEVQVLTERERDAGWAAQEAGRVLDEQRTRFSEVADPRWAAALQDTAERESEVLRAWLQPLPIVQLRIPGAWDAPRAVAALADRLGTDC
ncbi:MAG: hypothetical protein QOC68_2397 [Solirubrobacteraceae bacterium]|jgi:hypothetical protein|nr:hypothetical protein [Solirubrobacteraceae bacterium]